MSSLQFSENRYLSGHRTGLLLLLLQSTINWRLETLELYSLLVFGGKVSETKGLAVQVSLCSCVSFWGLPTPTSVSFCQNGIWLLVGSTWVIGVGAWGKHLFSRGRERVIGWGVAWVLLRTAVHLTTGTLPVLIGPYALFYVQCTQSIFTKNIPS